MWTRMRPGLPSCCLDMAQRLFGCGTSDVPLNPLPSSSPCPPPDDNYAAHRPRHVPVQGALSHTHTRACSRPRSCFSRLLSAPPAQVCWSLPLFLMFGLLIPSSSTRPPLLPPAHLWSSSSVATRTASLLL